MEPDFGGYASQYNFKCTDGKIIRDGAFEHMDGARVPLLYQHGHDDPFDVLGHAVIEHRASGPYVKGYFNESERGRHAKLLVQSGDVESLSIHARNLTRRGDDVLHGDIKEVSLVLAGANPGAFIDYVNLSHGDFGLLDDEAIIYSGLALEHADEGEADMASDTATATQEKEETVEEVFNTLNDKQKAVVYGMLTEALGSNEEDADEEDSEDSDETADEAQHSDDEGETLTHVDSTNKEGNAEMTRNVFEQSEGVKKDSRASLTHAQIKTIVDGAKRYGSWKESMEDFLQHDATYGIDDIDLLFPDAKTVDNTPELLKRQTEWVSKVLGGTTHKPFAKIKSLVADLTAEEARAKGYIKGTEKKDEVIKLLRRTTGPATVYKKQKLDRDDIIDITDFDVVQFLWGEIRLMLNEELARAILVGDGRQINDEDKIKDPQGDTNGEGIRSIAYDHDLYAHKVNLPANVGPEARIEAVARARQHYRGSGTPTYYTTDSEVTDLLLLKDKMGRRLYATEAELASVLRVKEIVAVEVMEEYPDILGIMVNLQDYAIGTNKGGELSRFEDFDIDFNQHKYLLETRLSGALIKLKSAVVLKRAQGTEVIPTSPSFDGDTNTVTVPTITGVTYSIGETPVTTPTVIEEPTTVVASADTDYYFPGNTVTEWTFVPVEID